MRIGYVGYDLWQGILRIKLRKTKSVLQRGVERSITFDT